MSTRRRRRPPGGFVLSVERADLGGVSVAWVVPESGETRGINVAARLESGDVVDLPSGGWARYADGLLVEIGVPQGHRVEFRNGSTFEEERERRGGKQ